VRSSRLCVMLLRKQCLTQRREERRGRQGLHITTPDPFPQTRNLVLVRRDELLPHEAGVTGFDDGFHDGGVVDFLAVVEFAAAGDAGGGVVAQRGSLLWGG